MDDAVLGEVKTLWRTVDSGILSTTSVAVPGYPFGSVVPYVTTADGVPVIYISDIARISLLGDGAVLEGDARDAVSELYFARFPMSRRFANTHGFSFWGLQPKRIRFIGGFGKIHWIAPSDWSSS